MFTEHEIINDLENRRRKNRRRWKVAEQCRQVVLELDVDWADFRRRFSAIDAATLCKGPDSPNRYRLCWSLLDDFELDEGEIGQVLDYFDLLGAHCDCLVNRWIDLTQPTPIGARCLDCHYDYDEYYMVHDEVWKQTGLGGDDGQLCIGCLEKRIGRRLGPADFIDAPINQIGLDRSLRLESRLWLGELPTLQ